MSAAASTPYQRRDQQRVLDLLFNSRLVHTHLDWYEPGQWLASARPIARLLWQGENPAAFIAFSPPLNGFSWLRVLALVDEQPDQQALRQVWEPLEQELREEWGVQQVAALILNDWLVPLLERFGFRYHEQIITLRRSGPWMPPLPEHNHDVQIRTITHEDMVRVAQVDHAAFAPQWQLRAEELRHALRYAASCTVAVRDDEVIGYQLSTRHNTGAHLARLAVAPQAQRQGVGSALLRQQIQTFLHRGVQSITVNTQRSNTRSQALYRRFGFRYTSYDLPVWTRTLQEQA